MGAEGRRTATFLKAASSRPRQISSSMRKAWNISLSTPSQGWRVTLSGQVVPGAARRAVAGRQFQSQAADGFSLQVEWRAEIVQRLRVGAQDEARPAFFQKEAEQFSFAGVHGVEAAEYPVLAPGDVRSSPFSASVGHLAAGHAPGWPAGGRRRRCRRSASSVGDLLDEFLVGAWYSPSPANSLYFSPIDALDPPALGQDLLQGGQDLLRPGDERGEIGDLPAAVHPGRNTAPRAFVDGVGRFQLVQDPACRESSI